MGTKNLYPAYLIISAKKFVFREQIFIFATNNKGKKEGSGLGIIDRNSFSYFFSDK